MTATAFLAMCAWVVIMASSQAHAASGLTAKASTTVPAKSYVKATVKIVLTTPKAGATKKVRISVAKASAPTKSWRGKTRKVTLRWSKGAYRGSVAATAKKPPKVTVKVTAMGKPLKKVVKAPLAKTTVTTATASLRVRGGKHPVSVTVSPAFKRTVKLQRKSGGTWLTEVKKTVSGSALKTVTFNLPATKVGTSKWRIAVVKTAKAKLGKAPFTVTTVDPGASTVVGIPKALVVTAANPGRLAASIYPAFGRNVSLQEYNPNTSSWLTIDTITTNKTAMVANISFALPDRAQGVTKWRLRAPAVAGAYLAVNSSAISVTTDLGPGPLRGIKNFTDLEAQGRPIVIAHRGGSDRYPEQSREAYEAAAATGFVIEADLRPLADGTPALLHDASTARTIIDVNGKPVERAINSITPAEWANLRIRPAYVTGIVGTTLTWEQLLDEFGGRATIAAEVKTAALARRVVDDVADRGLADSVILQSNSQPVVDAMTARAVDRGVSIRIRRLLTATFFSGDPAQLNANLAGLFGNYYNEYLGASLAQTSNVLIPYVQQNGFDQSLVIPYSVSEPDQVRALLMTDGIVGFSSDDPWYVWSGIATSLGY
ncbi:glycerophosphodiester phosphodiesterase [Rarobacter faecitabidus]|uniref:glycerophosphodiester phosphodiesterase n=1 Tax=Rarobacter faecitabidus TaxID=13243 RepID=UPI001154E749|nr:glycerophosphodiester phosphodiesterase [Rarobacter faecitabidus]